MVAKKNKAPPQPAVLHSQNTTEREDEENSNQPEEDIGNTTPQNEAEEPGTDQRGQWNEVVRRRRHRIIGTNHNDEHLQAAVKKAWLYIGKLKDTTTVDSLRKYIKKKGIAGDSRENRA